MNVNIPQLADTLFERTANTSWVVVFKSLTATHHLMVYGNEVGAPPSSHAAGGGLLLLISPPLLFFRDLYSIWHRGTHCSTSVIFWTKAAYKVWSRPTFGRG